MFAVIGYDPTNTQNISDFHNFISLTATVALFSSFCECTGKWLKCVTARLITAVDLLVVKSKLL